jgi:hypothetical protein
VLQHENWILVSSIIARNMGDYLLSRTNARFEMGNVEDRMYSTNFRQVQFVCHFTNTLDDLEGTKGIKRELLAWSTSK